MAKEKVTLANNTKGQIIKVNINPDDIVIDETKVMTVGQLLSRRAYITQIVENVMNEGSDYGVIPGTKKPTLYKSGADKLNNTFNVGKDQPVIEDVSNGDEIRYRLITKLFSRISGKFLGTGVGECSSKEEKYQWRRPVCKEEFNEASPERRKEKWEAKKDNRGWKIKDNEGNYVGVKIQMVQTNASDIANTILKMADKRSYIHATIAVLGISDLFEQDLEDLEENTREHILSEGRAAQGGKPEVTQPEQKSTTPPVASQEPKEQPEAGEQKTPTPENNGVKVATAKQVSLVRMRIKEKGITEAEVIKTFNITELEKLPFGLVNDALDFIYTYKD